jgi:hypothetical protein
MNFRSRNPVPLAGGEVLRYLLTEGRVEDHEFVVGSLIGELAMTQVQGAA